VQVGNSKFSYGALPQALHWLTAICVIAGWLLGQFIDAFPKGLPRAWALWTHITLGECVMLFLIVRLVWRVADRPPPPEPTRFGRLLLIASKLGHYTLYALLFAVPLVGIMVQSSAAMRCRFSAPGILPHRGRPIVQPREACWKCMSFSPMRF
jgi:cytochrome b561